MALTPRNHQESATRQSSYRSAVAVLALASVAAVGLAGCGSHQHPAKASAKTSSTTNGSTENGSATAGSATASAAPNLPGAQSSAPAGQSSAGTGQPGGAVQQTAAQPPAANANRPPAANGACPVSADILLAALKADSTRYTDAGRPGALERITCYDHNALARAAFDGVNQPSKALFAFNASTKTWTPLAAAGSAGFCRAYISDDTIQRLGGC